MTEENEVRTRVKKMGIKEIQYGYSSDPTCPEDLRYSLDIGQCPFSWHFYGSTEDKVWKDALAWLEKIKNKKCVCSW